MEEQETQMCFYVQRHLEKIKKEYIKSLESGDHLHLVEFSPDFLSEERKALFFDLLQALSNEGFEVVINNNSIDLDHFTFYLNKKHTKKVDAVKDFYVKKMDLSFKRELIARERAFEDNSVEEMR